jgi:hypothetical protein
VPAYAFARAARDAQGRGSPVSLLGRMPETVTIPSRFNGPLDSGNGGYCAGAVAQFLGGRAEVSLRRPVPLDAELEVVRGDGDSAQVMNGGELIAEGHAASDFDLEPPPPVAVEEAREAESRYRGLRGGMFSRCFVCGRDRDDALEVFAGAVPGRALVASSLTPPSWTAGDDGNVRPEFVWAVLDCPTYFALYTEGDLPLSVMARMTARVDGPVRTGEEHVVIAWPIEKDGRKHHAGSAVLAQDGTPLAVGHALLIAPRDGATMSGAAS